MIWNNVSNALDVEHANASMSSLLRADRLPRSPYSSPPPLSPESWPPKSKDNWIEIMVVADGPMAKYHGSRIREYVLSLMKIVSLIYRDKSLGNSLRMSVVKVLILDEHETFAPKSRRRGNNNTSNRRRNGGDDNSDERISASDMLKAFCKWQGRIAEYSPDDPQKYDVALLLTR